MTRVYGASSVTLLPRSTWTTRRDRAVDAYEEAELTVAAGFSITPVEHAEVDGPESDPPAVIVDFFEPDHFSGETGRQIPLSFAKRDHAVG